MRIIKHRIGSVIRGHSSTRVCNVVRFNIANEVAIAISTPMVKSIVVMKQLLKDDSNEKN
jgi:hypothetical protein